MELIERQAAIAHAISGRTREFEGEKWIRVSEVRESLKTMPPAQSEGRSGVFIPDITVKNLRNAPLEAVGELLVLGEMEDIVLPSAQPTIEERKRGRWIYHIDDLFPSESTQECSVCHEHELITLCHENYCPNCGAEMEGGKYCSRNK